MSHGMLLDAWARWQRQRKALRKLRSADAAIVSAAKSGRTWLAVMISHIYHQRLGIPEREVIRGDNFRRLDPRAPSLYFTHDNRKDQAHRPRFRASHFRRVKTILLVRDPRDAAVSAYFNGFRDRRQPRAAAAEPIDRMVVGRKMPQVIRFLERWQRQLPRIERHLVVRYEDLRRCPEQELARVVRFIDEREPSPEEIANAVAFAAFDDLRRKEASGFFATDRLQVRDPSRPESFKVRRGKVGGYRDYFTPDQLARIEALIEAAGLRAFGYRPRSSEPGSASRSEGGTARAGTPSAEIETASEVAPPGLVPGRSVIRPPAGSQRRPAPGARSAGIGARR